MDIKPYLWVRHYLSYQKKCVKNITFNPHYQFAQFNAFSNMMFRFAHCVTPKTRLLIGSIQPPIRIHQMICFEGQHREQYWAHHLKEHWKLKRQLISNFLWHFVWLIFMCRGGSIMVDTDCKRNVSEYSRQSANIDWCQMKYFDIWC